MHRPLIRICMTGLLAAGLAAAAKPAAAQNRTVPTAAVPADYQLKLQRYLDARDAYAQEAERYWSAVVAKRKIRNAKRRANEAIALADYVLTQPPLYAGPPARSIRKARARCQASAKGSRSR